MRWLILAAALVMAASSTGAASGQVLPPPSLGGPVAAFEQVLGGPNDATIGALLHYQRCAGTTVDQFVLLAPNDQVWTIQRVWCAPTSVAPDERLADAAQFLPADAVPADASTTELQAPGTRAPSSSMTSCCRAKMGRRVRHLPAMRAEFT